MPRKRIVEFLIKARDAASNKVLVPLSNRLDRLGKRTLAGLGRALKRVSQAIAVTLVGAFAVATRKAAQFQTRMAEVSTLITGDATAAVNEFSTAIINLSNVVPQSADDLGAGLYQVLSSGVSDSADAMHVLEVASKAAVAGLSDTFTSVDALTTVLNSYQLGADKATRVSDIFFETIKQGTITLPQLAQNIGKVASFAALAGVSLEELNAGLATMTKSGVNAAESTTALRGIFRSLVAPTDQAREAAEKLGVDWSVAAVQSKGFAAVIGELEAATKGNVVALQQIVPETEAFAAAAIIAGTAADEYRRILHVMQTESGQTEEAFGKMLKTFDNQWKLVKNKVNVVLIELGQQILPSLSDAMGIAQGDLDAFRNWMKDNHGRINQFATSVGNLANTFLRVTLRTAQLLAKLIEFADMVTLAITKENVFAREAIRTVLQVEGIEHRVRGLMEQFGKGVRDNTNRVAELREQLKGLGEEQRALAGGTEESRRQFIQTSSAIREEIKLLEEEILGLETAQAFAMNTLARLRREREALPKPGGGPPERILAPGAGGLGGGFEPPKPFDIDAANLRMIEDLEAQTKLSVIQLATMIDQLEWIQDLNKQSFGDLFLEAINSAEALQRVAADIASTFLNDVADAVTTAFAALKDGSITAGEAFKLSMMGALSSVASMFGKFFLGRALGAIADGLSGNPAAFVAAAQFTAAATAMFAVAGLMQGSVSAARGGIQRGVTETDSLQGTGQGKSVVIIKGDPYLDMSDPVKADAFASAVSEVTGRRLVIEFAG